MRHVARTKWRLCLGAESLQAAEDSVAVLEDLPTTGLPDEPSHLWLDSTLPSPRPSVEAYFVFLRDVLGAGPVEVLRT